MAAFATLEELKDRLDWSLDADEERIASAALEDASDLARAYGRDWTDATSAPRMVRTLVLTACARFMRNPEGYVQSRAGDETLSWDQLGDKAGTVYFTDPEIKMLGGFAGKSAGLSSAPVSAWDTKLTLQSEFVPVENPPGQWEKPFPFLHEGGYYA